MKKFFFFCLMASSFSIMGSAWAHPFRTQFVCVPIVEPNKDPLIFEMHDQGTCQENETFMEIFPQDHDAVILLPAEAPLSSDEREQLQNFKKYYGITR
jgi:hypothetical protein